jgi:hypothetical protein
MILNIDEVGRFYFFTFFMSKHLLSSSSYIMVGYLLWKRSGKQSPYDTHTQKSYTSFMTELSFRFSLIVLGNRGVNRCGKPALRPQFRFAIQIIPSNTGYDIKPFFVCIHTADPPQNVIGLV